METITYNKIRISERLPDEKGYYWTDTGKHFYDTDKNMFLSNFGERRDAFEWLEEAQAKVFSPNPDVSGELPNLADCVMGFVRSKHIRKEWDAWVKEWEGNLR